MVLPPLELFSLREELPCCRAALSVFRRSEFGLFRSVASSSAASVHSFPQASHSHAVDRVHAFKHRVSRTAFRTNRRLELRHLYLGLLDDLLWDRSGGKSRVLPQADRPGPECVECPGPARSRENTILPAPRSSFRFPPASAPREFASASSGSRTRTTASSMCTLAAHRSASSVSEIVGEKLGRAWISARRTGRPLQHRIGQSRPHAARNIQAALPQLVAQHLPRLFGQIAPNLRQFQQLIVVHLAVSFGESLPFHKRVVLHGEKYNVRCVLCPRYISRDRVRFS